MSEKKIVNVELGWIAMNEDAYRQSVSVLNNKHFNLKLQDSDIAFADTKEDVITNINSKKEYLFETDELKQKYKNWFICRPIIKMNPTEYWDKFQYVSHGYKHNLAIEFYIDDTDDSQIFPNYTQGWYELK